MVNFVFVSHSWQLAEGVKELATQLADGAVLLTAAGGILQDDGSYALGTDATRIAAAIEEVWTPDGVLILVDMGSAVLSADLALDLIPPQQKEGCCISNAPLVEGAVAAVLEASMGQPLQQVNQAAEAASQFNKLA